MNVQKSIKVLKWVESHLQTIREKRPTQNILAVQAADQLGFKVSTAAIKDCLQEHGIETKRVSKAQAQIDALRQQVKHLETLLAKLIVAPELPNWLREELAKADLPPEAKAALARMDNGRREPALA
jgi:hypothetical protein